MRPNREIRTKPHWGPLALNSGLRIAVFLGIESPIVSEFEALILATFTEKIHGISEHHSKLSVSDEVSFFDVR